MHILICVLAHFASGAFVSSFALPQITVRRMTNARATKEWIKAVAASMNLSVSDLARKSGMAASTLTRYINDASGSLTVTDRTLDAIVAYSGIPKHVMPGQRRVLGFGEPDAVPFERDEAAAELPDWVRDAVRAAKGNRNGVEPWIMKGRSLDLLGVLPGDVLLIDQNRRPKAGDIVRAQVTDLLTGSTETVIRRFDPPFIVAHSAKLGPQKPELVDDDRVVIMGVEVGVIRSRH